MTRTADDDDGLARHIPLCHLAGGQQPGGGALAGQALGYVIRCQGPRIQLWLNGARMVDYTETDDKIDRGGIIALQIHGGGPSEAWYKDITITELK